MKRLNEEQTGALSTIGDWVRFGASWMNFNGCFFGHGTDNALDEALVLMSHIIHLPVESARHFLNQRLTVSEIEQFKTLLDARTHQRIPAPYLTHEAWFAGLSFYVDQRVLIPRSPLAEVIEHGFEPWAHEPEYILELGTGSGCIALACAAYCHGAHVDAVDIDEEALRVARLNGQRLRLTEQVSWICSDMFEKVPARRYDVIISNPPYVPQTSYDNLPAEYYHEPRHALWSDDLGMYHVKTILSQAQSHLSERGVLIVEVGELADAVKNQFSLPFTWLEFERGGDGVFLLEASQLQA